MASENKKKKKKTTRKKRSFSHSVKKIKENERKYTIILVVIFMILFAFIGYKSLTINDSNLFNDFKKATEISNDISIAGQLVTLAADSIMSDETGKSSDPYSFSVVNNTGKDVNYHILFVKDDNVSISCGCFDQEISANHIHYTVEGSKVKKFNDIDEMVVYEGSVLNGEKDVVKVNMWLDSSLKTLNDNHFHGRFVLLED